MSTIRKFFKRSCRQVSRLISDREERPLGPIDRVALRLTASAKVILTNSPMRRMGESRFWPRTKGSLGM